MALVIALALMTGLQGELRDRILGSTAHVYVWKTGGIDDYRAEVETAAAAARRRRRGAGDPRQGADLDRPAATRSSASRASIRRSSRASPTSQRSMQQRQHRRRWRRSRRGRCPGSCSARTSRSSSACSVGDTVTLLDAAGHAVADGHDPAARAASRVAGIYTLGLYEFDSAYGFVVARLRAAAARQGPAPI